MRVIIVGGAPSIRPPLPGIDLPGIFEVRTVPDARVIFMAGSPLDMGLRLKLGAALRGLGDLRLVGLSARPHTMFRETGDSLMTWLQRYRIKSFLRTSVWLPPLLGMMAALLALPLVQWVDRILGWKAVVGPDGARAVLAALSSSMLTFIVFVFSILLVAVQLASAQLTPRIIALVYRSRVIKFSLTIFVFAFTYTLAALSRIDDSVPQISMWVATFSSVLCIGVFLYMIDHVGKSLRPVSIMGRIGSAGHEVIQAVYPHPVEGAQDQVTGIAPVAGVESSRTVESRRTGVVLAFDVAGLVDLASRAGCVIEFVPQVGDFVTDGDPLFRLYRGGGGLADRELEQAVAIGPERTMEQDPEFAFRIIVDIAAKALSPAINDPTTAVLALDQIHRLLRVVARRQLDTGRILDSSGQLRLAYRTPDWENFVSLAVTEIRHFGRDSIQIVRRMRAMLENLIEVAPPHRAAALRAELRILNRGAENDFRDPEDRILAASADSLGVGGTQ
jgi:uncharacterized membrane protein